jgi:hypothetical protein
LFPFTRFTQGAFRMPFVARNTQGAIVAVAAQMSDNTPEAIAADSVELLAFVGTITATATDLARSDQAMIRVVEDLISTLIDKSVIRFTDLPEAAQAKLMRRSSLRRSAHALTLMDSGNNSFDGEIRL